MNHRELRPRVSVASSAPEPGAGMKAREDQCRCSCGALLARIVREGLEIKCRKCKSIVVISHAELAEMYRSQGLEPPPPPVR